MMGTDVAAMWRNDWLATSMEAWLLGSEAAMVMGLRFARLAAGGSDAWVEADRMVMEKVAANWELGLALAQGRLGTSAESVARGTLRHYRPHVRANRRRLTR